MSLAQTPLVRTIKKTVGTEFWARKRHELSIPNINIFLGLPGPQPARGLPLPAGRPVSEEDEVRRVRVWRRCEYITYLVPLWHAALVRQRICPVVIWGVFAAAYIT